MNQILDSFIDRTIVSMNAIKNSGAKSEHVFEIDCSTLQDYLNCNILESEQFKNWFMELQTITGPCVYWYEIASGISNTEIIGKLDEYKKQMEHRVIPVYRKNYNQETKILYVGKVKGQFYGRVIQHLGYHKQVQTQGLQLYHWAKNIDLKLKLHVIEFNNDMSDLVATVEQYFAKELNPLLGKHI